MALEWSGKLTAYDTVSIDRWMIGAHAGDTPPHTSLPLPLKFQRMSVEGHAGAEVGLANIQKIWSNDGHMWGAGIFDDDDPAAVLLAGKVDKGLINQISVDLYDCTVEARTAGDNLPVNFVSDWRLSSATLLADPKFHDARIQLVNSPSPVAATAGAGGVVTAKSSGVALTFAAGLGGITLTRETVTAGGTPPAVPAVTPPPVPAPPVPTPSAGPSAADRLAAARERMGSLWPAPRVCPAAVAVPPRA